MDRNSPVRRSPQAGARPLSSGVKKAPGSAKANPGVKKAPGSAKPVAGVKKKKKYKKSAYSIKDARVIGVLMLIAVFVLVILLTGKQNTIQQVVVVKEDWSGKYADITDEQIIRASAIKMGAQMDSIYEIQEEAERGINSLGYTDFQSMERLGRNKVEIRVKERKPVAVLDASGNLVLIDKEGCVLSHLDSLPTYDVVYVTGCELILHEEGSLVVTRRDEQLENVLTITSAIRKGGYTDVYSELNVKNENSFYLVTNTSLIVQFYDAETVEKTLTFAKEIMAQGITSGKVIISGNYADYQPTGGVDSL
ncbi:MAG: hypothetical protein IJC48_11635 [Clostridia bacterium]|nr:hypothetical protein [Clostridia bacterium]